MTLTWINNNFISKDQYAPFVVQTDNDYYKVLRKQFTNFYNDAKRAGADDESLSIIYRYSDRICSALREYYKGNIGTCQSIVKNLVKNASDNSFAVSSIINNDAFPGLKGTEIQFFRARENPNGIPYAAKEMLHLPLKLRSKTGNYRFSIPGVPSLYLGNTSYSCWIELGRPSEHDFMVSPVVLNGTQKIFNLAVMTRDHSRLSDYNEDRVHCWLKLIMLMMATSYRVEEPDRTFRSEYIISQSIMIACKRLGFDGVAYYSKRVEDEIFAIPAINIALFTDYHSNQQYSKICKNLKIGDSFNYALFCQLHISRSKVEYPLRCLQVGLKNRIGTYDRQFSYEDTQFAVFDQFLFSGWDKERTPYGNAVNDCE